MLVCEADQHNKTIFGFIVNTYNKFTHALKIDTCSRQGFFTSNL